MRHAPPLPRAVALAACAACAACALAILLAWLMARTPSAPVPAGPPALGFGVARALAHVRALAQAPRPTGSASSAAARAYLAAQVRALGLEPALQVETVQSVSADWMSHVNATLATVHNIVVRKPGVAHVPGADGAAARPAVLVTAHYDSAADTLGAADGAASAAALLEALRVLQAGPPLDNDLLVVFTDADAGLPLGTRAFVESHPWARRVRMALRFDHVGNRGPLELVDASHADAAALAAWTDVASDPHGSSFMGELYERLPQNAAAKALATGGFPVLQFAVTQGTLGPGGVHDLPQRLSSASLQDEGDTMVALLRRFGNARLPAAPGAHGQAFFALPLVGMVHYSMLPGWPLAIAACVLAGAACRAALRRRTAGTDILHAMFGILFAAVPAIFAAWICREGLAGLSQRYDVGVLVDDGGVRWQLLAFLLLPAAVFIPLQRRLQQRLGVQTTMLGALLAGCIALVGTCARAPGAGYVLAWPLLGAGAAWLLLAGARAQSWTPARRALVTVAGALPAVLLIAPAAHASLAFFTPSWLVLPSALMCLLAALCGMVFDLLAPRYLVRPLLVAGAACVGLAYAARPQWPDLPAPNHLVYFKDTPSWQAYWMYPPLPLDDWTQRIFPNTLHPYQLPYVFGVTSSPVWYAAAPRNDAVAWPDLLIEKDLRDGRLRHVEFRLRSKNRAPEIVVRLAGANPQRASVNGRVISDYKTFSWKLTLRGMDDQELRFAFDFPGDPGFAVYIQERVPGLPERDLPPRADWLPPLLPNTGTTVSSDVLVFR